jgi:hypothetical protein
MPGLYGSLFVKGVFDMESNNALGLVKNAESSIKYFKRLHEALEKCDEYSWDGEDSKWTHISADTKDPKLRKLLIDDFGFQEEEDLY